MHLLTANESISVFVSNVCIRLWNACKVTLAIVKVERLVSVHTDDVAAWQTRRALEMHMFSQGVALLLTGKKVFVERMLTFLLRRAFPLWRRIVLCRGAGG